VYAVEIQDEMIRLLNERKRKEKAANVIIIRGSDTTTNLSSDSIDLAIMVDVYHELQFPHEILQSLRQALTNKGKLLLIEYRGEDTALAIKPLHKTTVAQLNKEMAANGFRLSYQGEFLPIQHFLLYGKTSVASP
jgi:precorrin-6B methylase 2